MYDQYTRQWEMTLVNRIKESRQYHLPFISNTRVPFRYSFTGLFSCPSTFLYPWQITQSSLATGLGPSVINNNGCWLAFKKERPAEHTRHSRVRHKQSNTRRTKTKIINYQGWNYVIQKRDRIVECSPLKRRKQTLSKDDFDTHTVLHSFGKCTKNLEDKRSAKYGGGTKHSLTFLEPINTNYSSNLLTSWVMIMCQRCFKETHEGKGANSISGLDIKRESGNWHHQQQRPKHKTRGKLYPFIWKTNRCSLK